MRLIYVLSILLAIPCFSQAQKNDSIAIMNKSDSLFAKGVELYHAKKYQEAIPLFSNSDSLERIVLNLESSRQGYPEMWLASCYFKLGNIEKAKSISQTFYCSEPIDKRYTIKADSLADIIKGLMKTNDYVKELPILQEYETSLANIVGRNHVLFAYCLYNCAMCHEYLGDSIQAMKEINEYCEIFKNVYGKYSHEYLGALDEEISAYRDYKNNEEALKQSSEKLDVTMHLYTKESNEYARDLNVHAVIYSDMGNDSAAIRFGNQVLSLYQQMAAPPDSDYITSLDNQAFYYTVVKNYAKAAEYKEDILRLLEKSHDYKSQKYLDVLADICDYDLFEHNHNKAIKDDDRLLSAFEKTKRKKSLEYAALLHTQSEQYSAIGDFPSAVDKCRAACSIIQEIGYADSIDNSNLLNDLATDYTSVNQYSNAIDAMKKSIQIQRLNQIPDTFTFVGCLNTLGGFYEQTNDLQNELAQHQEALKYIKSDTSREYIYTLDNIAFSYDNQGLYDSTLVYSNKALRIARQTYSENDSIYLFILGKCLDYNLDAGEFAIADSLGRQFLSLTERDKGKLSPEYFDAQIKLAKICIKQGFIDEATPIILDLRKNILATKGKSNNQYIEASDYLAEIYSAKGYLKDLLDIRTEISELSKTLYGPESYRYAESLTKLAQAASMNNDVKQALELCNTALNIYANTAHNRLLYISTMIEIAEIYKDAGNMQKYRKIKTNLLKDIRETCGGESNAYANALIELSYILLDQNRVEDCFDNLNQALTIVGKLNGTNSASYAKAVSKIADINSKLDRDSDAIKLSEQCLNIYDHLDMHNTMNYAYEQNTLSRYYWNYGNYKKSYDLCYDALKLAKQLAPSGNIYYIKFIENVASNKEMQYNGEGAMDLQQEAVDLYEKNVGNRGLYIELLQTLASYQSEIGQTDKALETSRRALNLEEQNFGKNSFAYVSAADIVSQYEFNRGNVTEAINIELGNIDIIKKNNICKNIPNNILTNLASYYAKANNYAKATEIQSNLVSSIQSNIGTQNQLYYSEKSKLMQYSLFNSLFLAQQEHSTKILYETFVPLHDSLKVMLRLGENLYHQETPCLTMNRILYIICNYMLRNFDEISTSTRIITDFCTNMLVTATQSETSRERFRSWNQVNSWYNSMLPYLAAITRKDSLNSLLFDGMLFCKGFLLNTETALKQEILASGNANLIASYQQVQSNFTLLNKEYELPKDDQSINVDSLRETTYAKERQLMQMCRRMNLLENTYNIHWQDVQKQLTDSDAAIEFLNFPILGSDTIRYACLLLKKNSHTPKLIEIFNKNDLDQIKPDQYYTSTFLGHKIWESLKSELSGIKNIYFSPSGALNQIAIEYLPLSDGTNVSEKFNLYRLSSTRELVINRSQHKNDKAVLYGGIEYEMGQADRTKLLSQLESTPDSLLFAFRDVPSLDLRSLREGLNFLNGSETEVENISKCLRSKNIPVSLLEGINGTEDTFKRLSGKRVNIIHIATHGFFQPDDTTKSKSGNLLMMLGANNESVSEEDRALSRSGLFFAGAKDALNKKALNETMDDGILTAKEISRLDLRGLNLLVLSACQTGQGDVTSEGVFGLQRGFKKAGAQTIVMSLWSVNDDATQILMQQFYKNLTEGKSKRESFVDAQKYLRTYDNGKYNKPEYWAAFIMLDGIK